MLRILIINRPTKTLSKTVNDLKILKAFFAEPEINEFREIHEIPEAELSSLLCRFLVSVKKQNGDDYEPSVIRGMVSSFDRQLRRKGYGQTISQGPAFKKVIETLAMKQRQLKRSGKGNLPKKSDPLSDDDIKINYGLRNSSVYLPLIQFSRLYGCITPYILVCEAVKNIVICVGVTFPCSLTNMAVNICSSPKDKPRRVLVRTLGM